jgi:UDP-glucose 4-epimerase
VKILISGGSGFIGSHLCEKYVKDGHIVFCLDNFLSGSLHNIKHLLDYRNFKLIKGDIRDKALLEKVIHDIEVIFHLAAQIHVDRSYVEPELTWDINVMGTQNVLEMARLYDVRRVIFASSSEVYGTAQYVPIDEAHPLDSPHPYGASKIAADRLCFSYQKTYGMDIAIMRPFNIFGARQRDVGYGAVISIFTKRVLNDIQPIVYGNGHQRREYTYIDDIVRAYDLVLRRIEPLTEPVNFGNGQDVSIKELAEMIIELCGKKETLTPYFDKPRMAEVERLCADATKAKVLLGWQPEVSLVDGLKKFIEWYRVFGFERGIGL